MVALTSFFPSQWRFISEEERAALALSTSDEWTCSMNRDTEHNDCQVAQEMDVVTGLYEEALLNKFKGKSTRGEGAPLWRLDPSTSEPLELHLSLADAGRHVGYSPEKMKDWYRKCRTIPDFPAASEIIDGFRWQQPSDEERLLFLRRPFVVRNTDGSFDPRFTQQVKTVFQTDLIENVQDPNGALKEYIMPKVMRLGDDPLVEDFKVYQIDKSDYEDSQDASLTFSTLYKLPPHWIVRVTDYGYESNEDNRSPYGPGGFYGFCGVVQCDYHIDIFNLEDGTIIQARMFCKGVHNLDQIPLRDLYEDLKNSDVAEINFPGMVLSHNVNAADYNNENGIFYETSSDNWKKSYCDNENCSCTHRCCCPGERSLGCGAYINTVYCIPHVLREKKWDESNDREMEFKRSLKRCVRKYGEKYSLNEQREGFNAGPNPKPIRKRRRIV